jgi:hypothetical protein
MNKDFLLKLRESVEFREVMADARKVRPVVPVWRPGLYEDNVKLWEEIKFNTGAQAGFDALFSLLIGKDSSNG